MMFIPLMLGNLNNPCSATKRSQNMTMITSLLFLLFAVLQFSAVSGDDDTDNKGFVVAGYLPDYRIHAYMENMLVDDGDGSASTYHKTTEK